MRLELVRRHDLADRRVSTSSASRAVSSMRVPVGARMCRRIWPASTLGKKSRPSTKNRPHDSTQNPRNAARTGARRTSSAAQDQRCSARAHPLEAGVEALIQTHAADSAWRPPSACARGPSAASRASAPASATGCRTRASRTPRLRRAARTGSARRRTGRTSARTRCRCTAWTRTPAPRFRRRRRGSPRADRAHVQMALDVLDGDHRVVDQDPTESASPPSVMMLMVCPSACSAISDDRIDSGIDDRDDAACCASCRETAGSSRRSARRRSALRAPRPARPPSRTPTGRTARVIVQVLRQRCRGFGNRACSVRRCTASTRCRSSAPKAARRAGRSAARYWSAARSRRARARLHADRSSRR